MAKAKLELDEAAQKEAQYLQYIESTRSLSAMPVGFSSRPSVQYSALEFVFSGDGESEAWPEDSEFDDKDLYEKNQALIDDTKRPPSTRLLDDDDDDSYFVCLHLLRGIETCLAKPYIHKHLLNIQWG